MIAISIYPVCVDLYNLYYLFSLVLNGNITKAVKEIQTTKNNNLTNFFDSKFLLLLHNLKKRDYKKSAFYLNDLQKYKDEGTFEFIILSTLEEYIYLFQNNKIKLDTNNNFGNLSLINKAFQSCYLEKPDTESFFIKLTNSEQNNYS